MERLSSGARMPKVPLLAFPLISCMTLDGSILGLFIIIQWRKFLPTVAVSIVSLLMESPWYSEYRNYLTKVKKSCAGRYADAL